MQIDLQQSFKIKSKPSLIVLISLIFNLFINFYFNREINQITWQFACVGFSFIFLIPFWVPKLRVNCYNALLFLFSSYSIVAFFWSSNQYNWFEANVILFSSILLSLLIVNIIDNTLDLIKLFSILWNIVVFFGVVQVILKLIGINFKNFSINSSLFFVFLPIGYVITILSKSNKKRISGVIGLVAISFSILLSTSRGALLGIIIIIFWSVLLFRDKINYKTLNLMILIVLILGLLILVSLHYFSELPIIREIRDTLKLDSNPGSGRLSLWEAGIRIIKDNPIFGVGPGNFADYYYKYSDPITVIDIFGYRLVDYSIRQVDRTHAHNLNINLLAEYGLIGTIIFYWLFIQTLRKNIMIGRWVKKDPVLSSFNKALLASLLSIWTMGQYSGIGTEKGVHLWLIFGLIEVFYRLEK
jgi:O-antigen ligase